MNKIPIQCTEEQLNHICQCLIERLHYSILLYKFGYDFNVNLSSDENFEKFKMRFDRTDPPRWRAEKGGAYFMIGEAGTIEYVNDNNEDLDDKQYNSGNYFQIKEEAEQYAEKWRELFGKRGEEE